MKKIISVIKREYLQIIKTKGFIIGTILGPVIMAALIGISIVSQLATVKEQETIGVIDLTQEIFDELDRKLNFKLKDGRRQYLFENYKLTSDVEGLRNSLRQKVLRKELSAYIFIPEDIINPQLVFELSDGTEIKFSDIWMINFENSKWDFPQERSQIITSSHYCFLRDGSAASGKIIGYNGNLRFFELDNEKKIAIDSIKRIYFSRNIQDKIQRQIEEKDLSGGEVAIFLNNGSVTIDNHNISRSEARYASEHVSDFNKIGSINNALNSIVFEKRLIKAELDPQEIAKYTKRVGMKTIKVTKKGEEEDTGGTFIISYILVLILYMTLFFYGAIIMRGVIEEKNSRVVEVVLSSLRPFQLMTGKMLGIAAVGFTQYAIWALFGFFAFRYSKSFASSFIPAASGFNIPTIPPYIFLYFVIFFILGYFLYGTLYAAVGSMVNSEKEAQQLIMPISMFLIVPMLLMVFVLRNPNSSLTVILSMIPFFAPILMLMRICILLPPFIQVAGSIILLILTILLMVWLVSKIYRVGILMYGKRPNFREIVKWVRYG